MTPLVLEIYHDSAVLSFFYTPHTLVHPNIKHEIRNDARHVEYTLNPNCCDNDTILRLSLQLPESIIAVLFTDFNLLNIETMKQIMDSNPKLRMICLKDCDLLKNAEDALREFRDSKEDLKDLIIVVL